MNTLVIRTSDRSSFKRCRRKWGFSGSSRGNLEAATRSEPLWVGSGIHFALEDFHGYKQYLNASGAFRAYTQACRRTPGLIIPPDYLDLEELACGMLDYYEDYWLAERDPLTTYVLDGIPQVEITFQIPIPIDPEYLAKHGYDRVVYQGTFDRVTIDIEKRLWLNEYKSAKNFNAWVHFPTDPQVTAYCWAAHYIYDKPIAGVVYQQHRKTLPKPPRLLAKGTYSVAKNQVTTHRMYREALENLYGNTKKAPSANIRMLNELAAEENVDYDKFIRRDFIYRNQNQLAAEEKKILVEVHDMANKDLPLYPNPTSDCKWDCTFEPACVNMDDGSDWKQSLELITTKREEEDTSWRNHLKLAA